MQNDDTTSEGFALVDVRKTTPVQPAGDHHECKIRYCSEISTYHVVPG